jgi:hypothetical protein
LKDLMQQMLDLGRNLTIDYSLKSNLWLINRSVNGMDVCRASVCNENASAIGQPITDKVNANSEVLTDDSDLRELTLPTFKDSTMQVPLHFIRDLDQYFSIKRRQNH